MKTWREVEWERKLEALQEEVYEKTQEIHRLIARLREYRENQPRLLVNPDLFPPKPGAAIPVTCTCTIWHRSSRCPVHSAVILA